MFTHQLLYFPMSFLLLSFRMALSSLSMTFFFLKRAWEVGPMVNTLFFGSNGPGRFELLPSLARKTL